MKISAKEKIIKIFTNLNPINDYNFEDILVFKNISTHNYDPPAYLVRIVLIDLLGLTDYGRMDKISWHTVFKYKDKIFLLRDYKFGTWSIESKTTDEQTQKVALEIMKKIKIASNQLDKVLYKYLKCNIEKGDFYIKNLNQTLSSIYYFYLEETKNAINNVKKFEETYKNSKKEEENLSSGFDSLNERYKLTETAFNYTYSTIHVFYSYLEFILDVIYAFEQPNIDFWKFRKKCWNDRFKMLFNIKIEGLNGIYSKLKEYKQNYRNPLSHGLTNEISVLVPLPKSGLVPLSYQFLSNQLYYGFMNMNDIDISSQIITTFSSFFDYIHQKEPYSYYLRYVEYGFEIPIYKNHVKEIKNAMSCMEDFEEYLKSQAAYMDAVINRDI